MGCVLISKFRIVKFIKDFTGKFKVKLDDISFSKRLKATYKDIVNKRGVDSFFEERSDEILTTLEYNEFFNVIYNLNIIEQGLVDKINDPDYEVLFMMTKSGIISNLNVISAEISLNSMYKTIKSIHARYPISINKINLYHHSTFYGSVKITEKLFFKIMYSFADLKKKKQLPKMDLGFSEYYCNKIDSIIADVCS